MVVWWLSCCCLPFVTVAKNLTAYMGPNHIQTWLMKLLLLYLRKRPTFKTAVPMVVSECKLGRARETVKQARPEEETPAEQVTGRQCRRSRLGTF